MKQKTQVYKVGKEALLDKRKYTQVRGKIE